VKCLISDERILEYDIDKVLYEEKSPYQKILIVHSQSLGNLLVLDGLQSKFFLNLFLMYICFISVPLFLSFSDLLTSHKSEVSGQQSLRVVSWLIKALMFHRISFEYETLNCSLLVPAIALL